MFMAKPVLIANNVYVCRSYWRRLEDLRLLWCSKLFQFACLTKKNYTNAHTKWMGQEDSSRKKGPTFYRIIKSNEEKTVYVEMFEWNIERIWQCPTHSTEHKKKERKWEMRMLKSTLFNRCTTIDFEAHTKI